MSRIGKKRLASAILLVVFIALLLTQLVRASPIDVSVNPDTGPVGTEVVVSGVADTASGTVNIYFDIDGDGLTEVNEFLTSATANPTAPFRYEATVAVPSSTAGTHAIISNDVSAGTSAGDLFVVTPKIAIVPSAGPIGTLVTVTGTGFDGTSTVAIKFDGSDVTPVPAPETNDVGSFTATFPVPPRIATEYTITATDEASNTDSAVFTLLGVTISINPTSGPVGIALSVSGTQATPSGIVTVWWDDTSVGSVSAEADGTYSFEFVVPPSDVGEHDVKVEDQASTNTATQAFTIEPQIVLNKVEGPVATELSVTGTGFAANGLVDVTFDTTLVVDDIATDSTGSFTATFNVPASVSGEHTVTATDTVDSTITASALFLVIPKITIDVTEGPIGTEVQVTGTGFAATNSIVLSFGSVDVTPLSAPETDEVGSFTATFSVPPLPAGDYTITAMDEAENEATAAFTVWGITAFITPTHGPVGTVVTVTGTYATPEGLVTILWDSTEITTVEALEDGTYSYDLTVPASVTGNHIITVVDVQSTNSASKTFTVEPQIILTHEDGVLGDSVLVTGTGFSSNAQVDVYFDIDKDGALNATTELVLTDVMTDEFGSFEESFTVPWVSVAGNYQVTAVDEEGVTDDATFTVLFVMYTRSSEYFQGDYPSFFIQAVNAEGEPLEGAIVTIEVHDANGYLQYKGVTFTISDGTVPYDMQFFNWYAWYYFETLELSPLRLSSDASIGTWTWKASTEEQAVGDSFEVIESGLRTLLKKVDGLYVVVGDLEVKLEDINAQLVEVQGNIATIMTDIGTIKTDVNNINAKIVAIEGRLAIIETDIGTIQTDLEGIDAEILEIRDSMVTIKTDVGTIQVNLDSVQAKLTSIQGDLATITTTLGEIETKIDNLGAVSLEEIKGNIATIMSDIGTIKVNVNNINANITSIEGRLVTIETSIGTIQEDIDNINGRIVAIQDDMVTVQTDIGTIKTTLNNINTVITVTDDKVATVQTDIGTIKGRLTSIEGDIATIETNVGTVKTSTDNIQTMGEAIKSDTSLQIPSITLSLIAAIGAIAAAAMILRKVYMK